MTRDLRRLADTRFDLAVIGAGIYGVAIAWDAVQRGLSVALIDRGDFGGATSFNNHKTVHGGLRSLQQANLREMREFIRERRALSRIAPHLVHPLPFLIPTYRHPLRSRLALGVALAIHNRVGHDRNDLPDPSKHLPGGHLISRDECLRRFPGLEPAKVTGGAVWYDCQMYNTDRVTLAFVHSAEGAGAVVANHVEATGLLREGGRVRGVAAEDRLTGQHLEIQSHLVINAAGPWAASLAERLSGSRTGLPGAGLSKAMNLVIDARLATDTGLGGLAGGRFLFLLPWRHLNVIGTSHQPCDGTPDDLGVRWSDVDRLIAQSNEAFPALQLGRAGVRLVHRGLLPTVRVDGPRIQLLKDSQVHDHGANGLDGLVTVVGVRYTTARATAERAVDLAMEKLGRSGPPCRTAATPLAGGEMPNFDEFLRAGLTRYEGRVRPGTLRRILLSYGSLFERVLAALLSQPDLARPLGPECDVTRGEVLHAVRHEMALKLTDVLLRRTEAGSAGHPGGDAVREAAGLMAGELGWTADRTAAEMAELEAAYRIEE